MNLKGMDLYGGCRLSLKIFGRGTPAHVEKGSSFYRYLERQKVSSYLWLSKKYNVIDSHCEDPGLRDFIRRRMQRIVEDRSGMSSRASSAALGMILGKSSYLDRDLKESGQSLGIMHLFAASGLHLGIFFATLYLPLSLFFGKKHPVSLMIPAVVSFSYLWFLDFPVSLVRAFFFLIFASLKGLVHRRLTANDIILNGAIILFLVDPPGAISLSGAMSVGAVSGILLFYKILEKDVFAWHKKPYKYLASQLSLSISASCVPSSLAAVFFGLYSFSGILLNTFFVPLAGIILPLLYISLVFGMLFQEGFLTETLLEYSGKAMNFFVYCVDAVQPISLARSGLGYINITLVWLIGLPILLATLHRVREHRNRKLVRVVHLSTVIVIMISGPPGGLLLRMMDTVFPEISQKGEGFHGKPVWSFENGISLFKPGQN